jgi:hypothetical protein
MARHSSIPGGVLLEGDLPGLGTITSVQCDNAQGKFVINGRKPYIPNITPERAVSPVIA